MRPTGAELISVTTELARISFGVCASFTELIKLTDIMNETDFDTERRADMGQQNTWLHSLSQRLYLESSLLLI